MNVEPTPCEWAFEAARKIAKHWQAGKFRKDGGVVAGMAPIIQDAINSALAEREKGWAEFTHIPSYASGTSIGCDTIVNQ